MAVSKNAGGIIIVKSYIFLLIFKYFFLFVSPYLKIIPKSLFSIFLGFTCRLEVSKRGRKHDDHKMLGILKEKETELVKLENKCRKLGMQEEKLEGKVERLQEDSALYKELLQVCAFISLNIFNKQCVS